AALTAIESIGCMICGRDGSAAAREKIQARILPAFICLMPLLLERVRVVLCAPSHPGNIGASCRAMQTMGLSRLVLVNPQRFPHADAVALAAGATSVLDAASIVSSLDAALDGVALAIGFTARPREFAGAVLSARDAAREA